MNRFARILFLFIVWGITNNMSAQNIFFSTQKNPCATVLADNDGFTSDTNAVIVEPCYKGGEKKLYRFLEENLNYPHQAIERSITGVVVLKFVVEKDGSITNIKISRSVAHDIDEECIRVVQKMPRWKPGTVNGHPVRFLYCLPIAFDMQ